MLFSKGWLVQTIVVCGSVGLLANLLTLGACQSPTTEKIAESKAEVVGEKAAEKTATEALADGGNEALAEKEKEALVEALMERQAEGGVEATAEATREAKPETSVEAVAEKAPEAKPETPKDSQASASPNSTDPAVVWAWLQQQKYKTWDRAPGFPGREPSRAPHGGAVEIFINPLIKQLFDTKPTLTAWPEGSIIAKDGYNGTTLSLVAYMEKRSNGWLWFEWDGAGKILFQGQPTICTGCHSSGADSVRAFSFP